jgi:hypothetical protein
MPSPRRPVAPAPVPFHLSARLVPLGLLLLLGCDSSLKRVGDGGVTGGGGAGGPGITIGDASVAAADGTAPVAPGAGEQCAEEAIKADVAPLDLVVVLDASGSMRQAVGQKTRWDWVVEALGKFVVDPRSAGVGVGLDVFPLIINSKPCTSENDCGGGSGTSNKLCVQLHLCVAPGTDLQTTRSCDPSDAFCPAGSKCLPAGTCSKSGDRCLNVDQACPGGVAGNTCGMMGTVCKSPVFSCEVGDYDQPLVPIASLPAGAAVLTERLATTKPEGDTPLLAAYQGARLHLTQYLAAHPDHKGALVVASDGAPSGCPGADVPAVVAGIAAAAKATPAIPTYAIGVLEPGDGSLGPALEQMAIAGGTGKPFAVTTSADFGDKFLGALNDIRGKALPCEFEIPNPAAGAIDYGKVNVRTTVQSVPVDLHYVKNADACVTTTAGWFYDTDPNVSPPKRIHLCDAVCQPLKADASAQVELRFGCRTRID